MSEPDYIELPEAIRIVKNLASWLKGSPEGTELRFTPAEGDKTPIVFVEDAARAGRVLELLMTTSGMA